MTSTTSILSVGIDIGTTTTQVVFSRLVMENVSSYLTVPRVDIVDKKVVYKSEIRLTPLVSQTQLDGEGVRRIVDEEFKKARLTPQDTDTGAVIITGEAALKENAALVLNKMSDFAGDFVVSTAGPDLESIIAGKGSGAQQYSIERDCTVANLDIGGGTTNIAVFSAGETVATGCFDIGGRLIRLTDDDIIAYISPKARLIAESMGLELSEGKRVDIAIISRMTDAMNRILEEALGVSPQSALLERMKTPGSSTLRLENRIDANSFSGGVADCIYHPGRDAFQYQDIGVLLGRSIAKGKLMTSARLFVPDETIRATVIGAGSYTTTVSGSTITYAGDVLPQKNLPVLTLPSTVEDAIYVGDSAPLVDRLKWFLRQSDRMQVVLGLKGRKNPTYQELRTAAECIATVLDAHLPLLCPVFVSVEMDIAKALGQCLDHHLAGKRRVVCIDGIKLKEGDFLDMGHPLMDGLVIPVIVKTLVFG